LCGQRDKSGIAVRRAEAGDAERISELSVQLGYPVSIGAVAERMEPIMGREDHDLFVAATADGWVAGWVHVFERRLVMHEGMAEIDGLVVDERCRGEGVGRVLMERAEEWARDRGCTIVNLRSNTIRTAAHEFYRRIGYEEIKRQCVFRKNIS
jgi:GNAT superfamily N-acetyltransferase